MFISINLTSPDLILLNVEGMIKDSKYKQKKCKDYDGYHRVSKVS